MKLAFYIARRYLFSKKTQNVINVISGISILGITVGTFALIVILSAFNGLENLVVSLFNSFDPDIKISLAEGKTFSKDAFPEEEIKNVEGVVHYTEVLEESALLEHQKQQYIATIKGVSKEFIQMSGLDSMMVNGSLILEEKGIPYAVVGQGIAYSLAINVNDAFSPITIYMPKTGRNIDLNPKNSFTKRNIQASGVFSIQKDFDTKYVLIPLFFAQELLKKEGQLSAIELSISPTANKKKIKEELIKIAGDNFSVKTRIEQHQLLYKIMKSEKWAVFLILTFILILATFNSIASITMIIFDKKKDINMLSCMGAGLPLIKSIFLIEGILITVIGNILGLCLGILICYLQQTYKLINFEGNFVTDSIPVNIETMDVFLIFCTVMAIGLIAVWIPIRKISLPAINPAQAN